MRSRLIILGTGLFAQEVADIISVLPDWELVGFVEGIDREKCRSSLLGRPVTWIDDLPALAEDSHAVCAVGSTRREAFIGQAASHGLRFVTLVHPASQVFPSAAIREGVIVGAGAVVGAAAVVGAHAILNRGCLVGHHVTIGEYVTLGPGVNIGGKVRIGSGTYVGIGATVVDGITIGSGVMVSAGSLVSRNVPDRVQVAGVPARAIRSDIERY
jgi:sugar O-acyltransferase (sialic acid O-acetyltransferase NeuD family)